MRMLVLGRQGQIAQSLAALAGGDLEISSLGRPELDITEPGSIVRVIKSSRPDIVVNPAAYTAVDKAESEVDAAFAANREGAKSAAEAAATASLPIIHVSTDYVFSGAKTSPYVETDKPAPTGVYGQSKLEGERAVATANPAHVILRTAWVYSPYGSNFLKTMLRLAEDRDVVRVVDDQSGTPSYAPDIARGIVVVARKVLASPQDQHWRGIFHMVAQGDTTWAGFAEEIFSQWARRGRARPKVQRIATSEYPTPALRPLNSRLDSGKFQATFRHALPDWATGVDRCLAELEANAMR